MSKVLAQRENLSSELPQEREISKLKSKDFSMDISSLKFKSLASQQSKDSKQVSIGQEFLQQFCSKNATLGTNHGT